MRRTEIFNTAAILGAFLGMTFVLSSAFAAQAPRNAGLSASYEEQVPSASSGAANSGKEHHIVHVPGNGCLEVTRTKLHSNEANGKVLFTVHEAAVACPQA